MRSYQFSAKVFEFLGAKNRNVGGRRVFPYNIEMAGILTNCGSEGFFTETGY